jgi:uncharacterized YigZ family protein
MSDKYITIKGRGEAELIEKKSRFIAHVIPIAEESEAIAHIESIKKQYWDARHNVYAYRLGDNNQIQRYSDDGEPSGTAGMPVLDVLRAKDIKNTLIVVTRYFGGTLLGTGGLVRAYGRSASDGVAAAGLVIRELCTNISVITDYTLSGKVQYEANTGGYIIKDTVYTDTVETKLLVETDRVDGFIKRITDITNGKAEIKQYENEYTDKPYN